MSADSFVSSSLRLEDGALVENRGNVPVLVGVRVSDFVSDAGLISVGDVVLGLGSEIKKASRITQWFDLVLNPGVKVPFSLVAEPSSVKKGVYSGEVMLVAKKAV